MRFYFGGSFSYRSVFRDRKRPKMVVSFSRRYSTLEAIARKNRESMDEVFHFWRLPPIVIWLPRIEGLCVQLNEQRVGGGGGGGVRGGILASISTSQFWHVCLTCDADYLNNKKLLITITSIVFNKNVPYLTSYCYLVFKKAQAGCQFATRRTVSRIWMAMVRNFVTETPKIYKLLKLWIIE